MLNKPRKRHRNSYSRRVRNLPYLAWIRTLPCCRCGRIPVEPFLNEAAHTGARAYSQKAPDEQAVPLCGRCHRTDKDSQTNQSRGWFERNGIDLPKLVRELNEIYLLRKAA